MSTRREPGRFYATASSHAERGPLRHDTVVAHGYHSLMAAVRAVEDFVAVYGRADGRAVVTFQVIPALPNVVVAERDEASNWWAVDNATGNLVGFEPLPQAVPA